MKTTMRSDRRKNPESVEYELLTFEECKKLASESHCNVLDKDGKITQVKITSVKTWKTRPNEIVVRWKFGLYEYGFVEVSTDYPNDFFIRLVAHDDPKPTQESDDLTFCPTCGASGFPLGSLGALRWYRCRGCGIEYHS